MTPTAGRRVGAARAASTLPRASAAIAVVLIGIALATATLAASGPAAVAGLVGALAAGVLLVVREPRRATLLATTSAACAASAIATATTGTDLARGVAIASPAVAIGAAAVTIGTVGDRTRALLVAGALVAGPVRALVDDPFLDAACAGCRHSALAALPDRTAAATLALVGAAVLVAGILIAARRAPHPILLVALGGVTVASVPALAMPASLVATVALALAVLACARDLLARATAARRIAELQDALRGDGGATELLRRAIGDPDLVVHQPSAADSPPGVPIRVDGRVVASVTTTRVSRLAPLITPPSPTLLVALAGERVDAELDAAVEALEDARSAVVVRADEARRRLERDLHDGAQQHVLALGMELRAAILRAPDDAVRDELESCLAETMSALDDLREIAHGVYPPLLAIAGLAPALRALAARTGTAIEVGAMPGRLPQSVERVAYLLIDALAGEPLAVDGEVADGALRLVVTGGAAEPGALLRERIAAQRGTLTAPTEEAPRWLLTVPCA